MPHENDRLMHAARIRCPPSFDPGLAPVRKKFLAGFENEILVFEALKNEIAGRHPEQALAQIASRAHKIAGVAETLGFREIGLNASALEQAINAAIGARRAPHQVFELVGPQLEDLLDRLEAELD